MHILQAPFIAGVGLALAMFAGACSQPAASTPAAAPSPATAASPAAAQPTAIPTTASATPTTAAPTATKAAASSSSTDISISDLVARAKDNTEYSFTMEATILGQPFTSTVHIKGPLTRQEIDFGGEQGVMIADQSKKVAYTIEGNQNVATKQDISGSTDQANPNDAVSSFPSDTKVVGTETVDGKTAVVLEVPDSQQPMKVWIWADKGLLLRAEASSAPDMVSMNFQDYRFEPQPDSLFQLPAGIQVVDAPLPTPDASGSSTAPGQ